MADSIGMAIGRVLAAPQSQGLAEQQRQPSEPSVTVHHQTANLVPASSTDFRSVLTPILALVSPSGMAEEDRTEWLRSAYGVLKGIPVDLLKRGARAAALKADHPAKIIPSLMAEIGDSWKWRKGYLVKLNDELPLKPKPAPAERMVEPPAEVIPQEEINGWLLHTKKTALAKGWITQEQFDLAAPLVPNEE